MGHQSAVRTNICLVVDLFQHVEKVTLHGIVAFHGFRLDLTGNHEVTHHLKHGLILQQIINTLHGEFF